jgi:citrate lyase beta subunit
VALRRPEWLDYANASFAGAYPGLSGRRQPVHVVYGGAHLFKSDTCRKLGKLAQNALADYVPTADALSHLLDLPERIASTVHGRVAKKLAQEAVEDYRIDFEDGFGYRSDEEEDAAASASARETAEAMKEGLLPPFFGIRIKPLTEESQDRSIRTLELYLTTLHGASGGRTPDNFVVTLPKITVPEQVRALVRILDHYGGMRMEAMIETPHALRNVPALMEEGDSSCSALHFGPYDYMSSLGISGASQHLMHPACDFARCQMQVDAAGLDVHLSDGPTNILPILTHRGSNLSEEQKAVNRRMVHEAWKLHYKHVRHALECGYYQGWDLHPAQLPVRYAAVHTYFLESMDAAGMRLRNFIGQTAQATTAGTVFDDAATGQGLLNHFLRAVYSGALAEEDVEMLSGLTMEELRLGSFTRIMESRKEVGRGTAS